MPSRFSAALIALVAFAPGCQSRLRFETPKNRDVGQVVNFEGDAPRYEQRIAVEFSADNEVGVYVCLDSERDAVDQALVSMAKNVPGTIGSNPKAKSGTVEATVPAK